MDKQMKQDNKFIIFLFISFFFIFPSIQTHPEVSAKEHAIKSYHLLY